MHELYEMGMVHERDIEPFYPRVRDREDIPVLRDKKTGVIFLSTIEHMHLSHYEHMESGSYWGGESREKALSLYKEDDVRRSTQFGSFIAGKDFIDIGCGTGGLLDQVVKNAKSVTGVEPQEQARHALETLGYTMYRLPSDVPKESFDVTGLFHVFEHVTEPLNTLKEVHTLLRPHGTLILEVPHARDILLNLDVFKAFSLWSEHLVLHTEKSLRTYLEAAGFKDIRIEGFQRYPLANHIGWMINGKPGGQKRYTRLNLFAPLYTQFLKATHQTDTLIAFATK